MPAGAKPGERRGGGTRKGKPNKSTAIRRTAAERTGVMPLDVMLENMRFYHRGASDLLKKLLRTRKVTPETFVEYTEMLRLREASQGAARDSAPYYYPKPSRPEFPLRSAGLMLADRKIAYSKACGWS